MNVVDTKLLTTHCTAAQNPGKVLRGGVIRVAANPTPRSPQIGSSGFSGIPFAVSHRGEEMPSNMAGIANIFWQLAKIRWQATSMVLVFLSAHISLPTQILSFHSDVKT
jgi:hypothetical protein